MADAAPATTVDDFLGGRLRIRQPAKGYRAGTDPVYLAAAVPATSGESVLELGCGVGVASLCLGRRVAGLTLAGLERQADYADLARANARDNGIGLEVATGDLQQPPPALKGLSFDHVIANPPYFLRDAGTASDDPGREASMGEATPLSAWIDAATKRLRPGGRLTLIQAAERLPDLLRAMDDRLGGIVVHPLAARQGQPARRVIISARKGSRTPFRLESPTILHEGAAHDGDRDSYTPAASGVLRDGLSWPWAAVNPR